MDPGARGRSIGESDNMKVIVEDLSGSLRRYEVEAFCFSGRLGTVRFKTRWRYWPV